MSFRFGKPDVSVCFVHIPIFLFVRSGEWRKLVVVGRPICVCFNLVAINDYHLTRACILNLPRHSLSFKLPLSLLGLCVQISRSTCLISVLERRCKTSIRSVFYTFEPLCFY